MRIDRTSSSATRIGRRAALALPLAAIGRGAAAQAEYPSRPISMIVAFHAGGGTDIAARSVARYIEKYLGGRASIGVLNRPGGGGETGWTLVAQAPPDGYTIGFINAPAVLSLTIEKQTRYSVDSFAPIANLVYDPVILAVKPDSPYRTVVDVVNAANAQPGRITIGTGGAVGSSENLGLLQIERLSGAKFNQVHFGATAPLRAAILGGHIPLAAFNLSEGMGEKREGTLRILGAFSEQRYGFAPDVPTVREQGLDVISGSSRGLVAPAGVPAAILARLQDATKKALEDPEYAALAQRTDIPLRFMDGPTYGAWLRAEHAALGEIWRTTPWRT